MLMESAQKLDPVHPCFEGSPFDRLLIHYAMVGNWSYLDVPLVPSACPGYYSM